MEFNAVKIARGIRDYCDGAAADMSAGYENGTYDAAKADELYDDPGAMGDIIGDKLCWDGFDRKKNKEQRALVIAELRKMMNHLPPKMWDCLLK